MDTLTTQATTLNTGIDHRAHEVAPIDEEKDENQDHWQPDAIGNLGEKQNLQ